MKRPSAEILLPASVVPFGDALPPNLAATIRAYDEAQVGSDLPTLTYLVEEDDTLVNFDASEENKT